MTCNWPTRGGRFHGRAPFSGQALDKVGIHLGMHRFLACFSKRRSFCQFRIANLGLHTTRPIGSKSNRSTHYFRTKRGFNVGQMPHPTKVNNCHKEQDGAASQTKNTLSLIHNIVCKGWASQVGTCLTLNALLLLKGLECLLSSPTMSAYRAVEFVQFIILPSSSSCLWQFLIIPQTEYLLMHVSK